MIAGDCKKSFAGMLADRKFIRGDWMIFQDTGGYADPPLRKVGACRGGSAYPPADCQQQDFLLALEKARR
jgi:hypothetical protein